jgi:hypothetical protein
MTALNSPIYPPGFFIPGKLYELTKRYREFVFADGTTKRRTYTFHLRQGFDKTFQIDYCRPLLFVKEFEEPWRRGRFGAETCLLFLYKETLAFTPKETSFDFKYCRRFRRVGL